MSLIPFLSDDRPIRMVRRDFLGPNSHETLDIVPWDVVTSWQNDYGNWRKTEQLESGINRLSLKDNSKMSLDPDKFQVNIDVQHFAPQEISVKVVDGYVTVMGKHEEKRDEHGYISRQFVRKYALPKGCLPDVVESKLSSDGVLTVIAPKVLPLPSTGEKIVPITKTGPIKIQGGSSAKTLKE